MLRIYDDNWNLTLIIVLHHIGYLSSAHDQRPVPKGLRVMDGLMGANPLAGRTEIMIVIDKALYLQLLLQADPLRLNFSQRPQQILGSAQKTQPLLLLYNLLHLLILLKMPWCSGLKIS